MQFFSDNHNTQETPDEWKFHVSYLTIQCHFFHHRKQYSGHKRMFNCFFNYYNCHIYVWSIAAKPEENQEVEWVNFQLVFYFAPYLRFSPPILLALAMLYIAISIHIIPFNPSFLPIYVPIAVSLKPGVPINALQSFLLTQEMIKPRPLCIPAVRKDPDPD